MLIGKSLTKVFDALGELFAVLTVVLYAFLFLNANFNWVTDTSVLNPLEIARFYAALVTVVIVGLEFAVKRSFLIFLIFCALAAVVILFSFFPASIPAFLQGA
jgi:hypothetical protein